MTTKTNAPRKIGYARVSRADQRLDLQLDALREAGCDPIFADEGLSGAKRNRPEFDQAIAALREHDTLVVWKIDRMSRSLRHLVDIMDDLTQRGCHFESLTDKIDTSTPMGLFTYNLLGSIAQLERSLISERTKAGLESARKRGVRLGRPPKACWTRSGKRQLKPQYCDQFRSDTLLRTEPIDVSDAILPNCQRCPEGKRCKHA
ncbi:recombinase family protein [Citromicrobium bathyomarinum]|uniref:recombinase family protein n=1 Tax=Citromicrobium bathyomarinum TaxID=72174 RepID=UPI001E40307B|nr:recombinase family protein [Citromicrobium bathyomarinum]MCD1624332.1 recombinase family protein [Citromicrobium bathyomarinum]